MIVWRNLMAEGADYCALWRTGEGWLMKGTAIAVDAVSSPILAHYDIHCHDDWRTYRVEVECLHANQIRTVQLAVQSASNWTANGRELTNTAGCVDVDLAITPATNTLPIRRLKIPVGESREVTAAWIRFPDLEIEPLSQRYTRLSSESYLYESGSGFSSQITVDDLGLVISYKNAWEKIVPR